MLLSETINLNGGAYWNGYCEWGGYYLSRLPTFLSTFLGLFWMGIVSGVDIIFHASQLSSLPFAKLHIGSFPQYEKLPKQMNFHFSFYTRRKCRDSSELPSRKMFFFWFVAALSFTVKKYHVMPQNWRGLQNMANSLHCWCLSYLKLMGWVKWKHILWRKKRTP